VAHDKVPLLVCLFFLFGAELHAQGPAGTSRQQGANASSQTSSSVNQQRTRPPLSNLGDIVAQSIIDGQKSEPATVIIVLEAPPSPTLAYADFWNSIRDRSSQFWSNLRAGAIENPAATIVTVVSTASGIAGAITFNPESVSFTSEILGEGPTNLGIGPSLISSGLADALPSSAFSDVTGTMAADFLGAATGSKVQPGLYILYSTGKGLNDIAEQGAKAFEPQFLPVDPVEVTTRYSLVPQEASTVSSTSQSDSTTLSPPTDEDAAILERARQKAADSEANHEQLIRESADLNKQLQAAQKESSLLLQNNQQVLREGESYVVGMYNTTDGGQTWHINEANAFDGEINVSDFLASILRGLSTFTQTVPHRPVIATRTSSAKPGGNGTGGTGKSQGLSAEELAAAQLAAQLKNIQNGQVPPGQSGVTCQLLTGPWGKQFVCVGNPNFPH
jgi:hypothetical protein